jgi:hypothetical protein
LQALDPAFLVDYLDATLGPRMVVELEKQLASCDPSLAYLSTYRKPRELVKQEAAPGMPAEMKAILRTLMLDQMRKDKS